MRKTRKREKTAVLRPLLTLIKVYFVFENPSRAEVAADTLKNIKDREYQQNRHGKQIAVFCGCFNIFCKVLVNKLRSNGYNFGNNTAYNKIRSNASYNFMFFRKHTANGNGKIQKQARRYC